MADWLRGAFAGRRQGQRRAQRGHIDAVKVRMNDALAKAEIRVAKAGGLWRGFAV